MVRAILFDLGGVLVTDVFDGFDLWLSKHCNLPVDKVKALRRPHWIEHELGNTDGVDFMQAVIGELHMDADPEALLDETYSLIRPISRAIEILMRLRSSGKYRLGVVSNNSFEWSAHAKETLGLGKFFDVWVASCDIGMKKPDKDIYLYAAEKLGVEPGDCVFIDNKKVNVDGAIAAGMRGIQFKDSAQLEADLGGLGVVF